MIIKKFLGKTETEAIQLAKDELGSEAIVMNLKKVQPKGLAKLFVKGKVEVTAALDENPVYHSNEKKEKPDPEKAPRSYGIHIFPVSCILQPPYF